MQVKKLMPIGDIHFGAKSIFAGVHLNIKKGWRLHFFDPSWMYKPKKSKWVGKYVKYVSPAGCIVTFKVLFTHSEGGHTWLHKETNENAFGMIEGFSARHCKIITALEYGINKL